MTRKRRRTPQQPPADGDTSAPRRVVVLTHQSGASPFEQWFCGLRDRAARVRIANRLLRILQGGPLGDHRERIAGAVSELRIDYGPGYRIYFVLHGDTLIVLLGGGTKDSQQADIAAAVALWEGNKDNAERYTRRFGGGPA